MTAPLSDAARRYLADQRPGLPLPEPDDLDGWRRRIAQVNGVAEADALPHLAGYPVDRERDGALYVARPHEPVQAAADCAVLFFHGGGLVFFAGPMVEYRTAVEAMRHHVTVFGLDFRQPPDHPFPAAVDDGLDAYRRLLERYSPQQLCLSGFSGGGNVAVSTLYRARDEGLPMPAALTLTFPLLDLSESGESQSRGDGSNLPRDGLRNSNRLYAGDVALDDARVSPLFGDPRGLPPTLIQAGEHDVLLADSTRFHSRLQATGVPSELEVMPGAVHGGFGGNTPEDAAARRRALLFMLTHWGV
jgi:monoterpene epsilon-lactone hydrolase